MTWTADPIWHSSPLKMPLKFGWEQAWIETISFTNGTTGVNLWLYTESLAFCQSFLWRTLNAARLNPVLQAWLCVCWLVPSTPGPESQSQSLQKQQFRTWLLFLATHLLSKDLPREHLIALVPRFLSWNCYLTSLSHLLLTIGLPLLVSSQRLLELCSLSNSIWTWVFMCNSFL